MGFCHECCRTLSQLLFRQLMGPATHRGSRACRDGPATLSPQCQCEASFGPMPMDTSLVFYAE